MHLGFRLLLVISVLLMATDRSQLLVDAVAFNAPLAGDCPDGFDTVSSGCYQFSNYSSTSLTREAAKQICVNQSDPANGTVVHLVALESLGETISLYYSLKGGRYNHSFWMDTIRSYEWDWRFEWSDHRFVSNGYLSDLKLTPLLSNQNYMYLFFNTSSKYEYRAASDSSDSTLANQKMGYICEAQIPCKAGTAPIGYGQPQHDVCKNNGTCYTNNGKVLCVCPNGYAGLLCELVIDTCDSSPCLNGGNCTSSLNNYTCDCTGLFFEGPNCENEIPYDQESNRTIIWAVSLGVLLGLIGFLCLMDFPLMSIVSRLVDKKNKFVSKAIAKKEKRKFKRALRQERLEQQKEIQKRIEFKEAQRKEIKPEQFLASEEEMLRRFKMALANSNKPNSKKPQVEPQFTSKPGSARVFTDMKANIKPTYQEYQE